MENTRSQIKKRLDEIEEMARNAGGSGGVGENLAPYSATAERFNDYDAITADSSGFNGGSVSTVPYDHIEGYHNYSTGTGNIDEGYVKGAGANHLSGQHNKAENALGCTISGQDNTLTGAAPNIKYSSVSGSGNSITNGEGYDVSGKDNTITGGSYYGWTRVSGNSNTVSGCRYCDIGGDSNHITNCTSSIIQGLGIHAQNVNRSLAIADSSTVTDLEQSIYVGAATANNLWHSIVASSAASRIVGNNQFSYSIAVGESLEVLGGAAYLALFGRDNVLTQVGTAYDLVAGADITLTGGGSNQIGKIALGYGATNVDVATEYQLILGCGGSNGFGVDVYGNVYARGSYNTMGADYAEYFEWAEKSEENRTRRGYLVQLCGDKIIPAHGDDFIGVISANPSIVGNACELHWHGKYLLDDFGEVITNDAGKPIISPEYDQKQKYIPRSQRPEEWAAVGLLGRMVIVDDGSCKPGRFVSARYGIGTKCYARTNARVLRRINENHCEVLVGGR